MSTDLLTDVEQGSTERPRMRLIRDGVAGNYDTIYAMIRLIRRSTEYDLGLERLIAQIIKAGGLDSYSDPTSILTKVYNFVKTNVAYIQDVAGRVESIKNARRTLQDGFGDCDDQTILNATLLGDLGFEDVRIAMTSYSNNADSFEHVYAVVYVGDKRYVLDTTLPHGYLNEEMKPTTIKEIPVFSEVQGLDGISGLFNNIKHHGKATLRGVAKAIPFAANFVPLGFTASHAFSTGINLLQQASGHQLSVPASASQINDGLDEIIQALYQSNMAIDLAKTYALQLAAQLAAIPDTSNNPDNLRIVGASIKKKLDLINNFPTVADAHGIPVVHLNPTLMIVGGVALVGGIGGYALYHHLRERRLQQEQ